MAIGTAVFEDDLHINRIALQRFLALSSELAAAENFVDLRPTMRAVRRVQLGTLRQQEDRRPSIRSVTSARKKNERGHRIVIVEVNTVIESEGRQDELIADASGV